jgi:hypothetical protein
MEIASLTLSPFTVVVISALVIPILTGLLTKLEASAQTKALVTLVLSIVAGAVNTATQADGTALFSQALVQNTVLTLATSVATYLGVYKPVVNLNARTPPGVGLS